MFYIHRQKDVVLIKESNKSDKSYCVIGPFETKQLAEEWVERHLSARCRPVTATIHDIRQKEVQK